jgi:kynurenine formamidase
MKPVLCLLTHDKGTYHLPGFNLEAVQFLHEQRKVKGIATDTLNLDAAAAALAWPKQVGTRKPD